MPELEATLAVSATLYEVVDGGQSLDTVHHLQYALRILCEVESWQRDLKQDRLDELCLLNLGPDLKTLVVRCELQAFFRDQVEHIAQRITVRDDPNALWVPWPHDVLERGVVFLLDVGIVGEIGKTHRRAGVGHHTVTSATEPDSSQLRPKALASAFGPGTGPQRAVRQPQDNRGTPGGDATMPATLLYHTHSVYISLN